MEKLLFNLTLARGDEEPMSNIGSLDSVNEIDTSSTYNDRVPFSFRDSIDTNSKRSSDQINPSHEIEESGSREEGGKYGDKSKSLVLSVSPLRMSGFPTIDDEETPVNVEFDEYCNELQESGGKSMDQSDETVELQAIFNSNEPFHNHLSTSSTHTAEEVSIHEPVESKTVLSRNASLEFPPIESIEQQEIKINASLQPPVNYISLNSSNASLKYPPIDPASPSESIESFQIEEDIYEPTPLQHDNHSTHSSHSSLKSSIVSEIMREMEVAAEEPGMSLVGSCDGVMGSSRRISIDAPEPSMISFLILIDRGVADTDAVQNADAIIKLADVKDVIAENDLKLIQELARIDAPSVDDQFTSQDFVEQYLDSMEAPVVTDQFSTEELAINGPASTEELAIIDQFSTEVLDSSALASTEALAIDDPVSLEVLETSVSISTEVLAINDSVSLEVLDTSVSASIEELAVSETVSTEMCVAINSISTEEPQIPSIADLAELSLVSVLRSQEELSSSDFAVSESQEQVNELIKGPSNIESLWSSSHSLQVDPEAVKSDESIQSDLQVSGIDDAEKISKTAANTDTLLEPSTINEEQESEASFYDAESTILSRKLTVDTIPHSNRESAENTASTPLYSSLPNTSPFYFDSPESNTTPPLNHVSPTISASLSFERNVSSSMEKEKMNEIFINFCLNGDISSVSAMFEGYQEYIKLNELNADGVSPLIAATCNGHIEIVQILIEQGAEIDLLDTTLDWSQSSGYIAISAYLFSNGASSTTSPTTLKSTHELIKKRKSTLMLNQDAYKDSLSLPSVEVAGELGSYIDIATRDEAVFDWLRCNIDQTYQFEVSEIDHIVNVCVNQIRPSILSHRPIVANILFLSARYAHYFRNASVIVNLFTSFFHSIDQIFLEFNGSYTETLYWISNLTQLLHYLKRDEGMILATLAIQCRLSEMIGELYDLSCFQIEQELMRNLYPSIMEYSETESDVMFDEIQPYAQVSMRRMSSLEFLKKQIGRVAYTDKKLISTPAGASVRISSPLPHMTHQSPQSMVDVFQAVLNNLNKNQAHPHIKSRLFHQILFFLNAEITNRIISSPTHCNRSAALRLKINLSVLEEWILENEPDICNTALTHLTSHTLLESFRTLNQALVFLQTVTVIKTLASFKEIVRSLTHLNAMQIQLCIRNYKYEYGEVRIMGEVVRHVELVCGLQRGSVKCEDGDEEGFEEEERMCELIDSGVMLSFRTPAVGVVDGAWIGSSQIPVITNDYLDMLSVSFSA